MAIHHDETKATYLILAFRVEERLGEKTINNAMNVALQPK